MSDQYSDEYGNDITCSNCDVTAREWFKYVIYEEAPSSWMVGSKWYCSDECYEEATEHEG